MREPLMQIFGRLKTAIKVNKNLKRAEELVDALEEKLKHAKIEEDYFLEVKCPECGRTYKANEIDEQDFEMEKEAIEDWGYCMSCDHIRGELLDEEKYYRSL